MRILTWLDNYFSRDERKEINKLKEQIKEGNKELYNLAVANKERIELINNLTEKLEKLEKELLALKRPSKKYKPKTLTELSQNEIKTIINSNFKNVVYTWNDVKYRSVSIEEFKKVIQVDKTDLLDYIKETFDCENFAGLLKNRIALYYGITAMGVVMNYRGGHAFNIVVCSDGLYILEPQSDSIWRARDNNKKGRRYIVDGSIIGI